ncbi:unnamed protein product [Adineta ricciae]|uniref:Uncharacterized protein n=1 Tax=Adineta ricciae TaxID=249248 RepID=A0A815TKE3_ADIRI|nr:unnamed protein product [Adineta ricciae]
MCAKDRLLSLKIEQISLVQQVSLDAKRLVYVSNTKVSEVGCWQTSENSGALVAGGNNFEDQRNQLDHSTWIFVNEDQSVKVSNENYGGNGEIVADGNDQDNRMGQLSCPRSISFNSEGYFCVFDYVTIIEYKNLN